MLWSRVARLRAGCPGHPRLDGVAARKTWIAGSSPAMTNNWEGMQLMPAVGLLHRFELLRGGRALVFRLPLFVRHAVDRLAALILADSDALGVGLFLHPV